MLGDGDVEVVKVSRPLVSLVIQQDPGEGEGIGQDMMEQRVMDENFVRNVGLQKELASVLTGYDVLSVSEGVAQPVEDSGQVAAPQGGVHLGLLDDGSQWEGSLLHTAENICNIKGTLFRKRFKTEIK